jgi:hypothetical protein
MLVFSNQRLGPAAELMVSREIATALLERVATAARDRASGHWEHELVRWLDEQIARISTTNSITSTGRNKADAARKSSILTIDVGDIAFTPQHFDRQRRFLIEAIEEAAQDGEHVRAAVSWVDMIKAHPRDSVQFGRRWLWQPTV